MTTTRNLVMGVDVASTHTSIACLHGTHVIAHDKVISTEDVTSGIKLAIHNVLEKVPKDEEWSVSGLNVGTTHFIKSLVQRSRLVPVSVVRLCGPATRTLGPFDGFPDDLRSLICSKCFYVNGGYQIDGSVITDVDEKEILAVVKELKESEIRNVVISGVFSSKKNMQEKQVAQLFAEYFPEASLTLSSDIFSHGLLERENAAILNETLKPLCQATVSALSDVVNELCLGCPLFFTQNDGNLMSTLDALAFPVKILSSGPYNGMLGACHLSGVKDAIVVDIGGTTTTVGSLQGGLPRLSSLDVCLGRVNTNLRMPDVISIGLGGGSIVTYKVVDNKVKVEVGPNSVGKSLKEKALVFGGSVLTASDIATGCLKAGLGDGSKVKLSSAVLKEANNRIQTMLEDVTDQMKTGRHAMPVIFVGGGSILKDMSRSMKGVTEKVLPAHYQVAGAVGAALCQMSGYDDTPNSTTGISKEALDQPKILHQMLDKNEAGSSELRAIDTLKCLHLLEEDGTTGLGSTGQYENIFCHRNPGKNIEPKAPFIDTNTGEWVLTEYDVHCISIGAGILGSGGGGSQKIGLLRALTTLKRGQKIRVIHPKRLATESFKGGKVGIAGIMGSPIALLEKMTNGREIVESLTSLEKVLKTDLLEDNNKQKLEVQGDDNTKYVTDFDPSLLEVTHPGVKGLVALMCVEMGGLNTMELLSTGAAMGLPIVDCDGSGRAVPELQMFTPSIYGLPLCPATLVDEKGHKELLLSAKSPNDIEDHFRKALGRMGSLAAFASRPMSEAEVADTCIMFSISRCFKLGDTIMRAQKENKDPFKSICEHEGGVHLITGKIVSVSNKTTKAFDRGLIEIEGTGKYADQGMIIHFQNENLIAKRRQNGQEKVVATIPDIIAVFGINDGRAVMNEDIKNGMRVAVIALASAPQLRTDTALKFVSPRAVGYDFDFTPIGEYQFHDSIPPPP